MRPGMIPKLRLDALTDGVFAVVMTLLVLELRLPESFHPGSGVDLLHRLGELASQAVIYALSFYVLSLRWIALVRMAPRGEEVADGYTKWALAHLLLITFVPFTTSIMGRHTALAPAVWLYAANTILLALVAMRMAELANVEDDARRAEYRIGLITLIAASLLAALVSLVAPKWAMLAYLINLLDGPLRRWLRLRT
jgi:uncharacterized membrane protein